MRKMKDSGIEWIREIPESWDVSKLLYFLRCPICDGPHETPDVLTEGIPFISVDSLNESEHIDFSVVKKFISEEQYLEYKKKANLEQGDVLFTKAATIGKTAIVGDERFMVWSPIAIIKPSKDKLFYKYLYHLLNCQVLINEIILNGSYNTQINVGMREIESARIPITSLEEQSRIADYLDKKCAEIDATIAAKEKTNELLKEHRQSIIYEAVTKGLDPTVPMKDSGIEWIGEIPESWITTRIKYTSTLKGRIGWQGLKSDEYIDEGPYLITGTDFVSGVIDWKNCAHISNERFEEAPEIHIFEGDLLITKDGTVGKLAIAENCPDEVSLNSGVLLIRNKERGEYLNKYLYYVLQSDVFWKWFRLSQNGNSTIIHLYQEQFSNFRYSLPSINEQKDIVDYLDTACMELDSLINANESTIEKLKEYRQSVIYEAVTGKTEL